MSNDMISINEKIWNLQREMDVLNLELSVIEDEITNKYKQKEMIQVKMNNVVNQMNSLFVQLEQLRIEADTKEKEQCSKKEKKLRRRNIK